MPDVPDMFCIPWKRSMGSPFPIPSGNNSCSICVLSTKYGLETSFLYDYWEVIIYKPRTSQSIWQQNLLALPYNSQKQYCFSMAQPYLT